jgi:ParB family chromosome partitioning protein
VKETTMAEEARSRLGRGLASLMGDVGIEPGIAERPRGARRAPVAFLKANPNNPRRHFVDAEIEELAASIRQRGLIQPIVVRALKDQPEYFEIIAGERRWRAAQRAGLHDVPIVPLDVSDAEALEIAIIENVQRADLNAMEEARGYHALAADHGHSAEEIAKLVGKSRSHVANMMRLTRLPDAVQAMVVAGELSAGHARALIGAGDAVALARRIVAEGLSVRQTEMLAHEAGVPQRGPRAARPEKAAKDSDTVALEQRISDVLGLKVSVDHRDDGSGVVTVRYRDLEQLEEILRRLEAGA